MKAIGYVRVSTDQQADRGVSLDAQVEKIRAMAVVHAAELIEIVVDGGESAKNLKRPGMQRLLALIESGQIDTVVVCKLDRLTRSVRDLGELLERFEKRGVSLISVAESLDTRSAAGRLVITIMTAVSEWERGAIGERTRDALDHKRSNGERVGNIAFGYRLGHDGCRLEPDPQEQSVISTIQNLRRDGFTLRAVAAELNAQGSRTRRGSAWRLEHIARILNASKSVARAAA